MKNVIKRSLLCALFAMCGTVAFADDDIKETKLNPIITAMPSLSIAPDAVGGAMGDVGAATMPNIFSQHWNPAKYAFINSKAGASISYTPWLRKLVNDIALIYGVGYYKIGSDDNQAISASVRYFTMGDVPLTSETGFEDYKASPHEMAIDIAYSRKLTETFSGSIAFRYIRGDYTTGTDGDDGTPGNAFAADIAGYNESYLMLGDRECMLGLGFNISNIGSKISYDDGNTYNFLPTNMRLGGSLTVPIDDYNSFSISADINKLLVPSKPEIKEGETATERDQRYSDMSSISGIFKSFGDAPGGFKEELKEVMWSIGAEYLYNNQFAIRGGYYYENKEKGNRNYFSVGAGFKMSVFQLDAAYLISTAQSNPLDQTLRFSISFDMDGLRNLMK
ncbi:hypothetical protein M2132_000351 [Dysgonomonas sp. PH5-45]|uniref:type IX secretion system outer membrane channel protein PorV n=1 Tax=unclassified Dysgonomonas TaxID=2630389 RepID=UPI00247503C3|nr:MULTISPECIES: type IX secretion system outer membrane channel protein PorV [unclassified Dysgonomonas]MDH6354031.1 hypothetical protein [Dysgonomonas sp. PH5-45]MDH6386933.1 hypothetical protein [Dysgonomonas sp. PH5-37]